ncbi:malonate decarboxylase subunit alpha [Vibrio natriegens]|uniref:malonate decarboxylase subunit alpha n=1 Tax=Vibrio natriegens TaxID=691 RepID=UPI001EFCA4C5|nr:malonate decarboxylase subunit alpha [Vibrio natriegens]MCG9700997.1 malonate decarboxylase subunit alpha [Vibrio natriegens]CAH0524195.1 Acetyl-S-ACP:malonate ACP transferase [Catenococcus thiocycli]
MTEKKKWDIKRTLKQQRIKSVHSITEGKVIPTENIVEVMEKIIQSGDRVILEGNNQKQADFLARSLEKVNPQTVNNLHMIMPSVSLPEHMNIFEMGIAKKLDFAFAGKQSVRISQMLADGILEVGAVHTYIELYSRLYCDLIPNVALVAGYTADKKGNLYTGPSTEDTPALVEAPAFKDGIVIAQVNKIVDTVDDLPRVDIPGDWVDFVVEADKDFFIEPLFTRDPRLIKDTHILMAMMAIKGIYAKHKVQTLNHGIGFNTAAIELLLPTYGEKLGLKGKICQHWTLNPHPTLIPAIESGWVESVHSFGGELGMEEYARHRPDVFFTGSDGSMRSNRTMCQMAGQFAADMFIGATLQMDAEGNSSTVTHGRLSGFGGAPNMGHDPRGRRHASDAWMDLITDHDQDILKGKKLVVQMVETFQSGEKPTFVDKLDAVDVGQHSNMPIAPVMIYGDDVTHVLTEEGIAYLYMARDLEERKQMIAAVAGVTHLGQTITKDQIDKLRAEGKVATPQDLGIKRSEATRDLLAAKNMNELVKWSEGLYEPPAKFRSW